MIEGAGPLPIRNRTAWTATIAAAIVTIDHLQAADVRCALVAFGAALLGSCVATRLPRQPASA